MVDISRILEIQKNGLDSAKSDDIPTFYNAVTEFLNTDPDAQELIKDFNVSVGFNIESIRSNFIIKDGKVSFNKGSMPSADVSLVVNLRTMAGIATGLIDAQKAFLAGDLRVEGDFEKLIDFIDLLDLAYDKLGIALKDEREIIVDTATMRKFMHVYDSGTTDVDQKDIPLFFNFFCKFINLNQDARNVIEKEDLRVQMIVKEMGPFLFYKDKDDGDVKWSTEKVEDYILQFEVSIKTTTEVLLGGDAASAYLSGEVTATGNIAQALILQELLELFLELLPFTE